ncbi:hypothetical protein Ctob_013243 [Chrysochromulina tobinii]|uniref:Uncharacterized protein n=1 Tax=Chrysochromulina tobinii TaxID=1460289 RepID=A0A0M0K7K3_9EUKA|nr:hypothetical protein Ctob_013243 [Chrysochromulina tobinii]|eukprot:KOO34800.1 hypothetical protein Ctob_013243 [Chrysochromulina sp. CCMP291]
MPISPESRKPLHTQVQNLREERINLLETVRALREDKDNLRVQLAAASRRISELDAKVDDGDMKRASLQDECNAIRQTSQMHETIASQLRGEATAWQARLTHTESEHSRRTLAHERDFKQAEDKWAQERYQMMSELLAAQAEKRSAEENWRMLAAESSRSKQLLEAQRDDAMHRCARAEQSLALAMQEKAVLAEQLSHTANRASEERFVLEHQRGEAEKRAAEAIRRAEEVRRSEEIRRAEEVTRARENEVAQARQRLEYERTKANEALAQPSTPTPPGSAAAGLYASLRDPLTGSVIRDRVRVPSTSYGY